MEIYTDLNETIYSRNTAIIITYTCKLEVQFNSGEILVFYKNNNSNQQYVRVNWITNGFKIPIEWTNQEIGFRSYLKLRKK